MKDYQPHLDEGWTWVVLNFDRYVLTHPAGGAATIDYRKRGWALGFSSFVSGKAEGADGKGWRLFLCNQAKTALNKIYKDEK